MHGRPHGLSRRNFAGQDPMSRRIRLVTGGGQSDHADGACLFGPEMRRQRGRASGLPWPKSGPSVRRCTTGPPWPSLVCSFYFVRVDQRRFLPPGEHDVFRRHLLRKVPTRSMNLAANLRKLHRIQKNHRKHRGFGHFSLALHPRCPVSISHRRKDCSWTQCGVQLHAEQK